VTTAVDWIAIKVVADNVGKLDVSLSDRSPVHFPLAVKDTAKMSETAREPLAELVGQLKWIFDQKVPSGKRQRRE